MPNKKLAAVVTGWTPPAPIPSSEPGSISCHLSLSALWLHCLSLHTQSRLSHPGTISRQYFLSNGLLANTFLVRAVCTSSFLLVFRMTCDPQQSHNQLRLPDPGSVLGFPSYPNRQQHWMTTPSCKSSFPASPGHLTSGSLSPTCFFFFLRLVCKWY